MAKVHWPSGHLAMVLVAYSLGQLREQGDKGKLSSLFVNPSKPVTRRNAEEIGKSSNIEMRGYMGWRRCLQHPPVTELPSTIVFLPLLPATKPQSEMEMKTESNYNPSERV